MSIDLLKRCPLFAGLKDEDLKKVRAIATLRQAGKREVLFSEGEEAKGFYVILSGKVKLYKISPEGKEQILHVVSAPDAFAEAALFLEGTYPAFAEPLSDCQFLYIPKRARRQAPGEGRYLESISKMLEINSQTLSCKNLKDLKRLDSCWSLSRWKSGQKGMTFVGFL